MSWTLPLDELEICQCGRLICNDDDCDVKQRLLAGTFHVHTDKPLVVPDGAPTPDEYREMVERARLRHVAVAAIALQEATEAA